MLSTEHKLVASLSSVLSLIILKYVVDHNAGTLPQILQWSFHASLALAGGLATLSFCSLLGAISDQKNRVMSELLGRVSESPVRNFLVGFLITSYLNLVRPHVADNLIFLPYVEWVTLALACMHIMHTTMDRPAEEAHIKKPETAYWKRHAQEVKRDPGRDLSRVTTVLQQFIDHGTKEPLIVYLTAHLQRLGETEEGILKMLEPLIDYQENSRRRLGLLVFPWTKRKIAVRNKRAREVLLGTFINEVVGDQNGFGENKSRL